MDVIKLEIHNIKNIKHSCIELPFEKGIYALVGENGSGKSTLMMCLAQLVYTKSLDLLYKEDFDCTSFVKLEIDGFGDTWKPLRKSWYIGSSKKCRFNGMYEGSLFYGTRFKDSTIIDDLWKSGKLKSSDLKDADDYVKNKMSFILHGDYEHYRSLKKICNRGTAEKLGLANMPYFLEVKNGLVSQYRLSSGECLLVSLLHFLYNSIERRSLPVDDKILVLVDEIELALHPIATNRLLTLLRELVDKHPNLVVYLSSHSPEIIRNVAPSNTYKINTTDGILEVENNCYPSYLIRDLYNFDGPDFLLLVEDDLARRFVNKVLMRNNLRKGKIVQVLPVGGWTNVLELHKELKKTIFYGSNTKIVSILDGDVEDEAKTKATGLFKLFLPIKSIEKYLYDIVIEKANPALRKTIGEKYFVQKSLDAIITEYYAANPTQPVHPDKHFFFAIEQNLKEQGVSVNIFVENFIEDIFQNVDVSKFVDNLTKMLV